MSIFDDLSKSEGGYVFISHSHKDIEKVRKIRNELEDNGFEPLCFYLKCLNDESEIDSLIKREIDAREWFIYVDSKNARESDWVRREREYISESNKKKILTIDLNDNNDIKAFTKKVISNLKVYISYSNHDVSIAEKINNKLQERDYKTFFALNDLKYSGEWLNQIQDAIVDASKNGFVLFLLTKHSAQSKYVTAEIDKALEENGKIITVIVGDFDLDGLPAYKRRRMCCCKINENPTDNDYDKIIDYIGDYIIKNF